MASDNEQYLRPGDVVKQYKLTESTLHEYERQGLIHPVKTPGNHRRYRQSELDALFTGQSKVDIPAVKMVADKKGVIKYNGMVIKTKPNATILFPVWGAGDECT